MQPPHCAPSPRSLRFADGSIEVGEATHKELNDLFRRHHDQLWQRLEQRLQQHNDELQEVIASSSSRRMGPRGGSAGNLSAPALLPPATVSKLRVTGSSSCLTVPCEGPVGLPKQVPTMGYPIARNPSARGKRSTNSHDLVFRRPLPGEVEPDDRLSSEEAFPSKGLVDTNEGHTTSKLPDEVKSGSPPSTEQNSTGKSLVDTDKAETVCKLQVEAGRNDYREKLSCSSASKTQTLDSPCNVKNSMRRRSKSTSMFWNHGRDPKRPSQTPKHGRFAALILRDEFDLASSVLIFLNCMFIAVQLEYVSSEAEKLGHYIVPAWSMAIEIIFCLIFTAEFILRCWVHGRNFLESKDWAWTIFDGLVVLVNVFEVSYEAVSSGNTTSIRAVRTFRTIRAVRAVRVFRFFRELRMFVCSILGCFKALMWSAVVLVLFWYVCSVVLTTATYEQCSIGTTPFHEDCADLRLRFGTLRRSVLSLYMSMSGGVDWGDIYEVMDPVSEIYRYMFLIYLFFTMFGVLNIVTGIFVEVAKEAAQNDRDILVRSQLRHQDSYANEMIRLFQEIDCNGSGSISRDELQGHLNDERCLAYFEALKLDIRDVATLFDLIDTDNSGDIDVHEFLSGCQRLKGESRALDLAVMRAEILNWRGQFWDFAEQTQQQLGELTNQLSTARPPCLS